MRRLSWSKCKIIQVLERRSVACAGALARKVSCQTQDNDLHRSTAIPGSRLSALTEEKQSYCCIRGQVMPLQEAPVAAAGPMTQGFRRR